MNIATGCAMQPATWLPHYAVAKTAMVNTTVGLARASADTGITVNAVSSVPVFTPVMEHVIRGMAKQEG
jgi:3-oxoacyl-[acyl-carrier protein] reductase